MPPISTSEVNTEAAQLIDEWISGMSSPLADVAIGAPSRAGTSLVWSNAVETSRTLISPETRRVNMPFG